jgi:diguanylate cyclase (GGDEF)-like protein/PAS domain S-box-containing protein
MSSPRDIGAAAPDQARPAGAARPRRRWRQSLAGLPAAVRRGRRSVQLGLGIAALLFFASLGVSMFNAAAQYRLEARMHRSGLWLSSHATVEAALFDSLLRAYMMGEVGAARLEEQFEVAYSRIILLGSGDRPSEYAQLEQIRGSLPVMLQAAAAIDRELPLLVAGDRSAYGRILVELGVLHEQLRQANLVVHQQRQQATDVAVGGMRRLNWTFLASGAGMLLSAGLLVALLIAETRRARRSLGSAKAAAERQSEAERTLRALIDSLPAMISAYDRFGRHLFMNEAHARFHGKAARDVPPGEHGRLELALDSAGPLPFQERALLNQEGEERTLLTTAVSVPDGNGTAGRVVFIALDITERKLAEERVRHLAEHDPLTDLPNRLLFSVRLNAMLAKTRSGVSEGFALHCVDLDRFKAINDSLGHPVGDKLLLAAVERMRGCLRRSDTMARIGGDEFAIIQADVGIPADAARMAERLVRVMTAPFKIEGCTIETGVSVGTSLGQLHGQTVELLQQRADVALYRAKAEGRGRAVLFDPAMETALQERRQMEAELREGLAGNALHLLYQPKFSLRTGAPTGCEALLRWNHAGRGAIPPSLFVPVAEEAGMAGALGRYVLHAACAQALAWRSAGLEMPVAVNLSAALFASELAVELVAEALSASGLPPHLLEIELTEGVFIRNAEAAQAALQALRGLGVRVALDDFGTGYSSLAYLQHLPFDVLKVDRAFVHDLGSEDDSSSWIVETILRLAHGLGASVVAEGVETPEQLAALRRLGCDAAQGYLLGRPMQAEALTLMTAAARVVDSAPA